MVRLGLGMIVGTVILLSENVSGNLNHRSGWGTYHISESKIPCFYLQEQPEENHRDLDMTMEEIDSDFDPTDDKERLGGKECYTVKSIYPVNCSLIKLSLQINFRNFIGVLLNNKLLYQFELCLP